MNDNTSSFRGMVALIIAIFAFFTPRLFLSFILIGIAIFAILGLAKDKVKIYAVAALLIGGFILYAESVRHASGSKVYEITYQVECDGCDVRYTNATGGDVKLDNHGNLFKKLRATGDTYINLSAMNSYDTKGEVTASVYVNGVLLKTETGSGKGALAYVSVFPKEVDGF
ncbi:hypothetical protein [Telluribacter sp.]|jgi:hypothetical protein|uniref:hypothetical protein n=1 Tax=Telluribacter sp. TaxID=1978767 RepID=UPI002E111AD3|nr:hypothetical protein [Telluribacter sp.]